MDKDVEAEAGKRLSVSPDNPPIEPDKAGAGADSSLVDGLRRLSDSSDEDAAEEHHPSSESLLYLTIWLTYTLSMDLPEMLAAPPQTWFPVSSPEWFDIALTKATDSGKALRLDLYWRDMRKNLSNWLFKEHVAVQNKPIYWLRPGAKSIDNTKFAKAIDRRRASDKIYLCQWPTCLAMKTSSLLVGSDEDKRSRIEDALTSDAQKAQGPLVLLVPGLTQVSLHLLTTVYKIQRGVFYKHTQPVQGAKRFTLFNHWGDLKSPPLFDVSRKHAVVSLYFEGDMFGMNYPTWEVEKTPLTYEIWPILFCASGHGSELYLRTSSPMTVHAFQDVDGSSKAMVNGTFTDSMWASSKYPAFGYDKAEARVDGEPMLESGTPHEAECSDFCKGLSESLSLWGLDATTDPEILLQAALRHTWPRAAAVMSTIISRDRMRLQIFTERCFLPGEDPLRSQLNEEVTSLEFFDRHVLYQLDTLEALRDNLGTPAFHIQDPAWQTIRFQITNLHQQLKALQERSSYLMAGILRKEQRQLTYSQLDEASLVRKLTIVALFFIPISTVTSAYGMNLQEIQSHAPSLGTFIISLIVVTGLTFIVAAFDAIRDLDAGVVEALKPSASIINHSDFFYFRKSDHLEKIAGVIRDLDVRGLKWQIPFYKLVEKIIHDWYPLFDKIWVALSTEKMRILYQYVLTGIPRLFGLLVRHWTSAFKFYQRRGKQEREERKAKRAMGNKLD
ncbi:hypothetical protein FH972_021688 [Carpinus fangiana]|uniref:Uncharacterized protein n=1 Tax=Carpinus fangiana TaxID=176857 RepID=A0A5N6KQL8_9ROSI|nr:hypothetical protein FH972_021688 [Carpinus fangiana]